MKLKAIVKYQISEYKVPFIVYYAVTTLLFMNTVFFSFSGKNSVSLRGGNELSSIITFFIIGICIFSENFNLLTQNGISRKSIFAGRMMGLGMVSVLVGVLDHTVTLIFKFIGASSENIKVTTLMEVLYPEFMSRQNPAAVYFIGILFSVLSVFAFTMLGNLIATGFYRSGKLGRIAIAAGIPVFLFMVLPQLVVKFVYTKVMQFILRVIYVMWGIKSMNPFYMIGSTFLFLLIVSLWGYLLTKKAEVK